jgi:hypothetical protein
MLGGRAMARHGWALGLIIMAFNVWVVTEPDSPWTMAPAIVVVAAVPLQTWAAVAFAKRLRRKGRPHAEIAEGVGVA